MLGSSCRPVASPAGGCWRPAYISATAGQGRQGQRDVDRPPLCRPRGIFREKALGSADDFMDADGHTIKIVQSGSGGGPILVAR